MHKTLLAVLLGAWLMPAQTESPVIGVGPFLHIISDLDQSLPFYRDQLGLELSGPPGDHKFTDNPAVANLYGVPGKQFRSAVLTIPGSAMGIELVQWGEARPPKGQPLAGSGTVTLIIRRMASAKTLYDPDGFPVELEQSENPGAYLRISARDIGLATNLYDNVLGLKADRIQFTKAQAGVGQDAAFPEVGQGMLRIFVQNINALTTTLKTARLSVITTGGEPVTLPQGQRVIILRDPNNFYLQLMESPKK